MRDFGRTLLVTGGARSGKSRHAQHMAEVAGGGLIYIATAQAFDDEMVDRIGRHRADRDDRWRTVEAPIDLTGAIVAADGPGAVILVDCLTLWISNLLLADRNIEHEVATLIVAIERVQGRLILVTNEVGMGIVPDNALARAFRDAAGRANQRVAAVVEAVDLAVSGLTLRVKPPRD